jgi:hypothetical protein
MKLWRNVTVVTLFVIFFAVVSAFTAIAAIMHLTDVRNKEAVQFATTMTEILLPCVVLLGISLYQRNRIGEHKMMFKVTFGLAAPRNQDERGDMKAHVEKFLVERVTALAEARQKQEWYAPATSADSLEVVRERQTLRTEVEYRKRLFWNASDLAAYFDFAVKKHHKEWLANQNNLARNA